MTKVAYSHIYDDNGGHGQWVKATLNLHGDVEVRCHRVTSFAPDDGTIESSELLLYGTIRPDGQSWLQLSPLKMDGPDDATRLGLAGRRCYIAARELLGPDVAAKWEWEPDPGGWRTHPDAIKIAEQKREA